MPALNIQFTEAELVRLRERAKSRGVSMRTLAHDTVVSGTTQDEEDDLIMGAVARVMHLSENLLRRLADK
jgi:hypothetical protein